MPASSSKGPRVTPDGPAAAPSTTRRFAPSVLVIALVLLGGVLLVRSTVIEPLALGAGATALCLVGALAAGVAWFRRRQSAATLDAALSAALEPATDSVVADDIPLPAETELDVINEHASKRLLQLQVRSLASALEELQDLGLDDLQGTTVRGLIDNAALSQGRALVTVRALHDAVAHLSGAAATDRIEAALSRLGAEAWFERPALTLRPGQAYVTFASPPHLGAHEPDAVPAPPAVEHPDGENGTEAGPDADSDAAVTAPAVRRVLPVPAPAPVVEEPRSRRRRGRISTV